jgi:hypothetical protein
MISTVDDVARFYRALLTGRLLPPAQERELLSTIPVHDVGELFSEHYGLGIYRVHPALRDRVGTRRRLPRRLQDLRIHKPQRRPAGRHGAERVPGCSWASTTPYSSMTSGAQPKSRFAEGDGSRNDRAGVTPPCGRGRTVGPSKLLGPTKRRQRSV